MVDPTTTPNNQQLLKGALLWSVNRYDSEMTAWTKRAGVATDKIPEALAGGFAESKPLQIVGPEIAAEQGSAIPISGLAAQLTQLHANHGYWEQDPASLIKLFEHG